MGIKVGLQLFSIKDAMHENPLAAIRRAADFGYRYLEVANHNALNDMGIGFGVEPEALMKVLDDVGAKIVSAHIFPFDKEKFKHVLEYHAKIGNPNIVYPSGRFQNYDDVMNQCEMLNEYGEMAKAYGIEFYYHNHAQEFMTIDGRMIMDLLLENTDPDKMSFELDTFWAMRGGVDPLEYIRRHKERITLLHQKDMSKESQSPVNVFSKLNREVTEEQVAESKYCRQYVEESDYTEIGMGIMDIQSIIKLANEIGKVKYMILEQDATQMESEIASIGRSMEEFRKFKGIEWD